MTHSPQNDPGWRGPGRGSSSSEEHNAGAPESIETLPDASVFHTRAWQRVLGTAYGFKCFHRMEPGVDGPAGAVVALVTSPITGRRLVSLPFSDAAPFLFRSPEQFQSLFNWACRAGVENRCRYLEIRGPIPLDTARHHSQFVGHQLDLSPGVEVLWKNCSSAARRGVRRAESSGVSVGIHQDPAAMAAYYRLHCRTRRRQGVPPQSWRFFRIIHQEMIQTGRGFIALARAGDAREPVAGAVFLIHAHTAVYKFGASDDRFLSLRPNNRVMWESIRHLVHRGVRTLDFGRTDMCAEGLGHFKRGWGAVESALRYFRFDLRQGRFIDAPLKTSGTVSKWVRLFLSNTPVPVLRLLGGLAYRHVH